MGAVRKNAADIKMAVDAVELSFERDYITTFVLGTGDSDFTPLVHKLRELNRRVIGIGIEASTSALLPAACDEFLFYERLEGVEPGKPTRRGSRRAGAQVVARGRTGAATRRSGADRRHRGARSRRVAHPYPRGPRAEHERSGAGVDAQARHPAQGADVQRGQLRLPHLRRAPAEPRRAQRDRAAPKRARRETPRSPSRPRPATRTRPSLCSVRPSSAWRRRRHPISRDSRRSCARRSRTSARSASATAGSSSS